MSSAPFYDDAKAVAHLTGWMPEVVYTQWVFETDHFRSQVFLVDHNPAGITWYPGCGKAVGLPRPASEGGHYIHFDNSTDGYVWFIEHNSRYDNVKSAVTPQDAFALLKRDGWATDPEYANLLCEVYSELKAQGVFDAPPVYPGILYELKTPYMHDDNVKLIQRALHVDDDGIFGPITSGAVYHYQRVHGLVDDGIVGPKTWASLFN